jgi:oligosaccharide repeat unit polymerase
MFDNLLIVTVFDMLMLSCCSILLLKYGKLSIFHPATIYLVFHAFIFTVRLLAIINGASLFLSNSSYFIGTEPDEIIRAVFWADIGFLSMTIAWLQEAKYHDGQITHAQQGTPIDGAVINSVVIITIPLGIWGIFSQQYIPFMGKADIDFGEWNSSSYIANTQNFVVLSVMALIFKYGFKQKYLFVMALFLGILALQGYHRYRVLVPLIFMVSFFLFSKRQKWIPKRYWLIGLVGLGIFMPLKYIGRLVQEGASLNDFTDFIIEYQADTGEGANADFAFLDMYAVSMSLIDQQGSFYFGKTFLPIILSPIPRNFWIEKPSLMQWTLDISIPERNISKLGAVCTIFGEAYANFWYLGIIIIPFLFARFSARWYFKILQTTPDSTSVLLYFIFIAILIQVYRDGLVSLFTFMIIYNLPCFLIISLSIFKATLLYEKRKNSDLDEYSECSSK